MINFITAPDAMREYDIREEQLFQVIKSGKASPYDLTGAELGAEGFERLIEAQIHERTGTAKRKLMNRAPRPSRWGWLDERDMVRLAQLQDSFNRTCQEISDNAAFQVLYSVCFVRAKLESALREVCPTFFQNYLASKRPIGAKEPAPGPARTKKKDGKVRNTSGSTPDTEGEKETRQAFDGIMMREGPEKVGEMTKDQLKGLVQVEVKAKGGSFLAREFEKAWGQSKWTNKEPGRRRANKGDDE